MFFTVGQKVILKYTNDEGVVTELHQDGMVVVRLDGMDMTIPVFEEDLRPANVLPLHKSPDLPKKPAPPAPVFEVKTQYGILQSLGLQLAFETVYKYENIDKYNIYLINDTDIGVVFIFKIMLGDAILLEIDNKIEPMSVLFLGELFYDELIEIPEAIIEAREVSTAGIGDTLTKVLKLKPQSFFKSIMTAPLLNKQVHHFVLFENFNPAAPKKKEKENKEDLKAYTKRVKEPAQPVYYAQSAGRKVNRNEIEEYANFNTEIDLHIENLTDKSSGMSNGEILKMQLLHFDRFMQKAYRLGVPRVFIIHGVGKGKLRDAIATKLIQEYDIETFRNEYHAKYGFGATEVVL
jgi:DNA-nicking Smr family endonuclease